MATTHLNGIGFEPGEVYESWASRDRYWGTKEALIAAGLAKAEWFPGDPRCPRKRVYRTPDGAVEISKKSGGKFEVLIEISDEEETRRRGLGASRGAASNAQAQIAALPKSADGFRSDLIQCAETLLGVLQKYAENGSGGYRVSKPALDELEIAIGRVVSALEASDIAFSAKARAAAEREIMAKCGVVLDSASRTFIDRLIARGPSSGG
jgi:hypothetical protein